MSRTYRRKSFIPEWVKTEWQDYHRSRYSGGKFPCHYKVPLDGEKLEKSIKEYQMDGKEQIWKNPPSWFINMFCQRSFRRHQKQVIKRMMKSGDFEDYCFLNPENPDWLWD